MLIYGFITFGPMANIYECFFPSFPIGIFDIKFFCSICFLFLARKLGTSFSTHFPKPRRKKTLCIHIRIPSSKRIQINRKKREKKCVYVFDKWKGGETIHLQVLKRNIKTFKHIYKIPSWHGWMIFYACWANIKSSVSPSPLKIWVNNVTLLWPCFHSIVAKLFRSVEIVLYSGLNI